MKKLFVLVAIITSFNTAYTQTYTPTANNLAARNEFQDKRFGMFIHWNIFSLTGYSLRDEWKTPVEYASLEEYEAEHRKYFEHFDPDLFDAREWARSASEAGMKYVVITIRHHEGFR